MRAQDQQTWQAATVCHNIQADFKNVQSNFTVEGHCESQAMVPRIHSLQHLSIGRPEVPTSAECCVLTMTGFVSPRVCLRTGRACPPSPGRQDTHPSCQQWSILVCIAHGSSACRPTDAQALQHPDSQGGNSRRVRWMEGLVIAVPGLPVLRSLVTWLPATRPEYNLQPMLLAACSGWLHTRIQVTIKSAAGILHNRCTWSCFSRPHLLPQM